jgi:hypothetical protein
MQTCSSLGPPGTSSFAFNVPSWSTEYLCGYCGVQPWFECHPCCTIPARKNIFQTLKQLRDHARHWHVQPVAPTNNLIVLDTFCDIDDVNSLSSSDELDNIRHLEDAPGVKILQQFCFSKKGTAQFAQWCIAGYVSHATHCVLLQSLLQAPVGLHLDTWTHLPPHSIRLFLCTHHDALSNIIVLVFSLILPDYKEWPTTPSTNAGFQSHILNPTNQHSLVSILSVPYAFMLPDESHSYCCLCEIAAYVLLLSRTTGAPPIPLRLTQLC